MARDITPSVFTVYEYDELSEDAKARAVETIRERLNGIWWDSSDVDDVTGEMVYKLAEKLKSPGWDTYGEGDFPGITDVQVTEWDVERGQSIKVIGTLTRENAPALPWADGIDYVMLGGGDYWPEVHVALDGVDTTTELMLAVVDAMTNAVEDSIRSAWQAGRDRMDYLESDEHALEYIEGNDREFHADGRLYVGAE
jgi:hypothetical protein